MITKLKPKQAVSSEQQEELCELIAGLKERESIALLQKLHDQGADPTELFELCIEGVRRVGLQFESGRYYISALVMAGEIMRQVSEYLNGYLPAATEDHVLGTVLLGTIEGDIHDLGKNILKNLLINNGFQVVDLGIDVSVETFVEKTLEIKPDFVAISCILTQCVDQLQRAVKEIKSISSSNHPIVLIGGACVDEVINDFVGADNWFTDAFLAVDFCKNNTKA